MGLADIADFMKGKKFLSVKDWSRNDYGRNAITGLLGGAIVGSSHIVIFSVIGDLLVLLGLICGVVWIYKSISGRKQP